MADERSLIVDDDDRLRQVVDEYLPVRGFRRSRLPTEARRCASGHLPHILDRFYRLDPSRSRGSGGTGLGLAIAQSLVRLHGGRIWAENEVGRGSRFTLALPVWGAR